MFLSHCVGHCSHLDVELFAIAGEEFVTHCGDGWDRNSVGAESCEGKEEIEDDVQHLDGCVLGFGYVLLRMWTDGPGSW